MVEVGECKDVVKFVSERLNSLQMSRSFGCVHVWPLWENA